MGLATEASSGASRSTLVGREAYTKSAGRRTVHQSLPYAAGGRAQLFQRLPTRPRLWPDPSVLRGVDRVSFRWHHGAAPHGFCGLDGSLGHPSELVRSPWITKSSEPLTHARDGRMALRLCGRAYGSTLAASAHTVQRCAHAPGQHQVLHVCKLCIRYAMLRSVRHVCYKRIERSCTLDRRYRTCAVKQNHEYSKSNRRYMSVQACEAAAWQPGAWSWCPQRLRQQQA